MRNHPTKAERTARFYSTLESLGFDFTEADNLRRIEMTLSRWSEAECNGEIERNEPTGKPERVSQAWINGTADKRRTWPCPDRETGVLKRLARIMEAHSDCVAYHQGDPRGCSLYIVRKSDIPEGKPVDQFYTRGFAVCV